MGKPIDIVVWSGGLDSTLVLDRLCSSGKEVWAFSVIWDMIDGLKTKQERIARKNYLKFAKEKGYIISYREVFIRANMGADHLGCAQALAWLSFLTSYLPEKSNLYFGYHKGDEFWGSISFLKHFIKYVCILGERKVKVLYPLQYLRKHNILREIKECRIPLSCVWTCEHPISRRGKVICCGKCGPCITLRTATCKFNNYKS